jgi:hypothetical protein
MTERQTRQRLASDAYLAVLALEILYENQTADERATGATIYLNGMGFNQEDAPILTPLARKAMRYGELDRHELATAFNRLPKYARQVRNYLDAGRYW